jgi:hypothetical protein
MSYCRWSSDNFKCDLYCYADVGGGYTTHVAGMKRVDDIPSADMPRELRDGSLKKGTPEFDAVISAWTDATNAQIKAATDSDMVPIGLSYDGASFNDPTLETFRARVVMLREAGYYCPDYVLERIDEEIAEVKQINRQLVGYHRDTEELRLLLPIPYEKVEQALQAAIFDVEDRYADPSALDSYKLTIERAQVVAALLNSPLMPPTGLPGNLDYFLEASKVD